MQTIKSSTEISDFFSTGRFYKTPYLTFIVEKKTTTDDNQHDPAGRVAFIAGKKIGNAVTRNKAKRRMRALCHDLGGPWNNYDVIFLAKSPLLVGSYSKVLKACESTLRKFIPNS